MKLKKVIAVIALCLLEVPFSLFARSRETVPNEVLVQFKKPKSSQFVRKHLREAGLRSFRMKRRKRVDIITLEDRETVTSVIGRLKQSPEIASIQPNYIYRTNSTTPNDPSFSAQWALANTGQTINAVNARDPSSVSSSHNPGTSGLDLHFRQAWDLVTDCSSVVVAVVDTGVLYDHEDLNANLWDGGAEFPHHGYDFVDDDDTPLDGNGHGTHVAGIIGAVGNNAIGISGSCWSANIMAVRVLNNAGAGTTATVVDGIDFAVQHGAKIINLSLGQSTSDTALKNAIDDAYAHGVLVVAAAGNDGVSLNTYGTYPCESSPSRSICVGAVDQSFALTSFSNYGSSVHVASPGDNVWSLWNGAVTRTSENFSGWSEAGTHLEWSALAGHLLYPSGYDGYSTVYPASADDAILRSYNFSAFDIVVVSFYAFTSVGESDYFRMGYHASGGNPFVNGTLLDEYTETYDTLYLAYDLSDCRSATCVLGFEFETDGTQDGYGVHILYFERVGTILDTESYNVIDGTSMATPYVSAIAAMVWTYNPNYTVSEVRAAVINGGVEQAGLASTISSSRVVDAMGALSYLAAPTGLSVKQIQ